MYSKEMRKKKIRNIKAELILDAALHILLQKGYYETRLEDIAEQAGFSKSALYRYYKDKEEIFITIAVRERNKVIEKLSHDDEYRLSNDNHISENLRRLLTVSFTACGENFSFLLTLNSIQVIELITALQRQKKLFKIEREFLTCEGKMIRLMIALFDNAKIKGEITSQLPSEVLFDFFQGILFVRVKQWHQQKKMEAVDEAVDEILCFLEKGMGITHG
jgi:AcrR family transcriptional regulator